MTGRRSLRCLRAAAIVLVAAIATPVTAALTAPPVSAGEPPPGGEMRITEWMYSGADGEFVELTNVGDAPVDLTGWSYDDDSATPGVFDLSGFGEVAAGESVVFTESDAAAFRAAWGLCAEVTLLGGYTNNLGRGDQINIFDGTDALVDVLTYGDEDFPGTIRTQNASGWVSEAGLGADDPSEWTLSAVGDAENSIASTGGAIGSPGRSTHGGFDPCDTVGDGETPSISIDQTILAGAIADLTNPGTVLTLEDPDSNVTDLVIDVSVANEAVIAPDGIGIVGDGAERTVAFAPVGRGVTTVTFTVTDPDSNEDSVNLSYAASNPAPDPSGRYHHHISDASSALDVGSGYMLLVNDETNTIFLHHEEQSGPPVKTWTFTSGDLGTSDEIDFEGIARAGDLLVITGSHGNNRSGAVRTERRTFIGATITGSGADTDLAFLGRYNGLWTDLRAWDAADGHGLGADALGFVAGTAGGVEPNPPDGFNVEAIEFAPDGETLYLGFRAPTVGDDFDALIVPLTNVDATVDGVPATGPGTFGAPIFLDLDGRSIRALRANEHGEYLISAGPSPQNETWALSTWDGDPAHDAQFNRELPEADLLTGGTWESIVAVPHPLEAGAPLRLVADSGDTNYYGTGATKDLSPPYQKSYSQLFELGDVTVEPSAPIRISEWMYSGADEELVELTNVGDGPVDLTGWSYDDDSATPGVFDLSGFGEVAAGESVVFTESDAEAFRTAWALCVEVKVLGGYTNNLGRGDQINIFDGDDQLVDRLTYGDEDFPGTIRTQNVSGWVSESGLGADDPSEWTLSTVDDAEGSVASTGGDVGSPGRSTHGGFDPCPEPENQPPVNAVPGAQSGNEDDGFVFSTGNGNAISVSDPDAGTDPVRTTLTVEHGTFLVGTADVTVTDNGTAAVQVEGPIDALNVALDGAEYLPAANYHGADTLSVLTDDLGHNGTGGPLTDTDTVAITIASVNDAPVLADIDNIAVDELTEVAFTAVATDPSDIPPNAITYSLVDAPDGGSIDPSTGAFTWTPNEAQGPASHTFTVVATDDGAPPLAADVEVTVEVAEAADPAVVRLQKPKAEKPARVAPNKRFEGKFKTDQPGNYVFEARRVGGADAWVPVRGNQAEGSVATPGGHTFQLRAFAEPGRYDLRIRFTNENGEVEHVRLDALRIRNKYR